ncbi:helix-turn-helix domain-containing protein [Carboxylicivirga sp. N1Y90]|uniref:helix-turn-helix domain-containing protein n=1 Tax=Carboxylicivirga fragile TaxID=3417571 RepID=UPI003D3505FA|nr:helix-turn-helix domain-containing protein [Marinilabiliaceae bacterium N1Y90]
MTENPTSNIFIHQSFNDFDLYQEIALNWQLDFKKLNRGKFNADISLINIGEVQIGRTAIDGTVQQQGLTPVGHRTFVIPVDNNQSFKWLNRNVNSRNLLVFQKDGPLDGISYDDFNVFTISIKDEHLDKLINQYKFKNLNKNLTNDEHAYPIDGNFVLYIGSFLQILLDKLIQNPELIHSPSFVYKLKYRLPLMLLNFLDRKEMMAIMPMHRKRDVCFQLALEYINRYFYRKISIKELCKHCSGSERTLEYAFKERFGIGPKAYVNNIRLNYAYRMIAHGENKQNVSEIAQELGFTHMGQFAADYFKLFEELPSETMAFKEMRQKNSAQRSDRVLVGI